MFILLLLKMVYNIIFNETVLVPSYYTRFFLQFQLCLSWIVHAYFTDMISTLHDHEYLINCKHLKRVEKQRNQSKPKHF